MDSEAEWGSQAGLSVPENPCRQPPPYSGLFGDSCSAKVHMHAAFPLLFLRSFFLRAASDKSPSTQGQTSRAEKGPGDLGMSGERGLD